MGKARAFVAVALIALVAAACSGSSASPSPGANKGVGPPPSGPNAATSTTSASAGAISSGDGAAEALGLKVVHGLAAGDYAGVEATFDDAMKAALPEAKLRDLWGTLNAQLGAYQGTGPVRIVHQDPYTIALVRTEFGKGPADLQVTITSDGRVGGFYVRPAESASGAPGSSPAASAPPAAYVDPGKFHEVAVTVGSAPWALPGTLTMPNGSGPFPAVVLVHGSGPNDRDETIGPNKPFRDLAWGLASQGIAVLRYDKRTSVYGAEMAADPELTVQQETIDDAVAAVDLLRRTPGVAPSEVFVLGHSLGGYLGPRIMEAAPSARGLVTLAGPSRPLPELIVEQYTYLASLQGSPSPDAQKQLDTIRRQAAVAMSPSLSPGTPASDLPFGTNAAYWIDLQHYDPLATAERVLRPMLLLQGGRDYQVTTADLQGWQRAMAGRSDVTTRLYPGLNHLFMIGTGRPGPADYEVPGHVYAQVVGDIASWIAKESAAG